MKYIIASDIHGSKYAIEKIVERFFEEKADKLILLGDLYYHGPRNPLPKDYAPMEVANILNGITENVLVVKGNCDAEVDQMISKFSFQDELELSIKDKKILFTHGHKLDFNKLNTNYDIIFYGHFHVNSIKNINGIMLVNPGSASLPKENSIQGYIMLDENFIVQKDLNGIIIESVKY